MTMEKLAYIDHSLHQKTCSTYFIIDILKKWYDVTVYWDESWSGGPKINLADIKKAGFKNLAFCQINDYNVDGIYALGFEQLITIPMYDSVITATDAHWRKYKRFKVWSFSRVLHERLKSLGLQSFYTQFMPDPAEFRSIEFGTSLRGFFWQRNDQISWSDIRKLIGSSNFESVRLHNAIDHIDKWTFDAPTAEELKQHNISISSWFPKPEDFQDYLDSCNVYFAPRYYEGIGKSFLEAMAKGMCVVAPDNGTMNEYIVDGETGILWDPDKPAELDFSNARQIAANAKEFIVREREKWLAAHANLGDFLTNEQQEKKTLKSIVKNSLAKILMQKADKRN